MKHFWLTALLGLGLLVGCDFDNSTFPVEFDTDERILRGEWKGQLREDFGLDSLAYSPSKNLLAGINSYFPGSQLLIFDGSNGNLVKRIVLDGGGCVGLKFQPSGKFLTCQHSVGQFTLWNLETWQAKKVVLRGPPDSTTELAHGGEFLYNIYFELSGSQRVARLQLRNLETNAVDQNLVLAELKTSQWLWPHHIDGQIAVYSISDQGGGLQPTLYLHDLKQGSTKVLAAPQMWCDSRNKSSLFDGDYHLNADGTSLGTTLRGYRDAAVIWNTGDGSIVKQFVQPNCDASFRFAGFTGSGTVIEDILDNAHRSLAYWNPTQGFVKTVLLQSYYSYLFQGDEGYGYWFGHVVLKQTDADILALVRQNTEDFQWTYLPEHYSIPLNLKANFLDAKTYSFSGSGQGSDGKIWSFSGKGYAGPDHVMQQRTQCSFFACPKPMTFVGTLSHPDLGSYILRGSSQTGSTSEVLIASYTISTQSPSEKRYFFSLGK